MSAVFFACLIGMLIVAIGIVVFPLIRVGSKTAVVYKQSNQDIYKSKVQELETDLDDGRIDKEHYVSALNELDHELLLDVPIEGSGTAAIHYEPKAKRRPVTALVVALFLPTFALLIYMQLGMHASIVTNEPLEKTEASQQATIEQMVQILANKLQDKGGTAEEWSMLARSYKHVKQYQQSADAFAKAITIEPKARTYLEQAEALALLNNKNFVGKARDLVMKALELAPNAVNTLWFAGVAEFQSGNYGESIDLLTQLSVEANSDPEIGQSIRFYVKAARDKLIEQGIKVESVDVLLKMAEPIKSSDVLASLEVFVEIKPEISELFDENAVVFVYAKALRGPRMPLAAKRLILKDLPKTVILDDSMAMMAGLNISAFDEVEVSARISLSGSAFPQAGDYKDSVLVSDVLNAKKLHVLIGNIVK